VHRRKGGGRGPDARADPEWHSLSVDPRYAAISRPATRYCIMCTCPCITDYLTDRARVSTWGRRGTANGGGRPAKVWFDSRGAAAGMIKRTRACLWSPPPVPSHKTLYASASVRPSLLVSLRLSSLSYPAPLSPPFRHRNDACTGEQLLRSQTSVDCPPLPPPPPPPSPPHSSCTPCCPASFFCPLPRRSTK